MSKIIEARKVKGSSHKKLYDKNGVKRHIVASMKRSVIVNK